MKRRIVTMGAAAMVMGAAAIVGTAGVTHAATATTTKSHVAKATDRHIRMEAKLNQAERDGVITADQKTAFLNEVKTLREEHKAAMTKSSTTAEREAERAKLKTELKAWATTNNFPLAKIFPKLAS